MYHPFGQLYTMMQHQLQSTDKHYLRVVEERLTIVGAASCTMWLRPRTTELFIIPALLKTKD